MNLRAKWLTWQDRRRLAALQRTFAAAAPEPQGPPVLFFNASSRLWGLSQNAAFQWITAWSLRLRGIPVVQMVCQAGLPRCVLAAARDGGQQPPPCRLCRAQSRRLYAGWPILPLTPPDDDTALSRALAEAPLADLLAWEQDGLPLGALITPGLRWALRRHHLRDDEPTRALARAFLQGAWATARAFRAWLERVRPRAVVVFNGQFYPEATVAYLARQAGLRTVTHEVGLRPLTAFFTTGEATAYPIHIPPDFRLTPRQEARLDAYLSRRFRGDFSMAGVRFWPTMRGLDAAFWQRARQFQAIVPVFTNVVFDTSQHHAHVLFPHMFAWLDGLLPVMERHPEILFVLRAHPDEHRPGKAAAESVRDWVQARGVPARPNVLFVAADQYLSSYELITHSKLVLIYNSTIGLEAVLLGKPVLAAAAARFTRYPIVYLPPTPEAYWQQLETFLTAAQVPLPATFRQQARRFLYYQLYKVSLPFRRWLEPHPLVRGYVRLRSFGPAALAPEASPTLQALHRGLLEGGEFVLAEEDDDDAFDTSSTTRLG